MNNGRDLSSRNPWLERLKSLGHSGAESLDALGYGANQRFKDADDIASPRKRMATGEHGVMMDFYDLNLDVPKMREGFRGAKRESLGESGDWKDSLAKHGSRDLSQLTVPQSYQAGLEDNFMDSWLDAEESAQQAFTMDGASSVLKALGSLPLETLFPEFMGSVRDFTDDPAFTPLDSMKESVSDDYFSGEEKLKEKLYSDPVGSTQDVVEAASLVVGKPSAGLLKKATKPLVTAGKGKRFRDMLRKPDFDIEVPGSVRDGLKPQGDGGSLDRIIGIKDVPEDAGKKMKLPGKMVAEFDDSGKLFKVTGEGISHRVLSAKNFFVFQKKWDADPDIFYRLTSLKHLNQKRSWEWLNGELIDETVRAELKSRGIQVAPQYEVISGRGGSRGPYDRPQQVKQGRFGGGSRQYIYKATKGWKKEYAKLAEEMWGVEIDPVNVKDLKKQGQGMVFSKKPIKGKDMKSPVESTLPPSYFRYFGLTGNSKFGGLDSFERDYKWIERRLGTLEDDDRLVIQVIRGKRLGGIAGIQGDVFEPLETVGLVSPSVFPHRAGLDKDYFDRLNQSGSDK